MTANEIKINITAKGADVAAKGLQKVSTAIKGTATSAGGLTSVMSSLKGAVGPMLAAFGAFKGAQALTGFLSSSVKEYENMRMATRGATEAQIAWASALEKSTGADADQALGLMRQAKQLGINESQLKDITAASVGLAEVLQIDVESAFGRVMQSVEGNASAFNKMIPGLKALESEEAKLAKISEVAAEGLKQRKENLTSLSGVTEQASHSWGNLKEAIGEILAPMVTLATHGFGMAAETLSTLLIPAVELSKQAMEGMKSTLRDITTTFVVFASAADVVFKEFPKLFELALIETELAWIEFQKNISTDMMQTLPESMQFMSNNWVTLFADGLSGMLVAFKNFSEAIVAGKLRLMEFLRSGFEGGLTELGADLGEIASRNMLKGFESKTLAEVVLDQFESREDRLKRKSATLGGSLGKQFTDGFQSRMDALNGMLGGVKLPSLESDSSGVKSTSLTATESRLRIGGSRNDAQDQLLQKSTEQLKAAAHANMLLAESNKLLKTLIDKPATQVEVVA